VCTMGVQDLPLGKLDTNLSHVGPSSQFPRHEAVNIRSRDPREILGSRAVRGVAKTGIRGSSGSSGV